jgi:hypothetical protein
MKLQWAFHSVLKVCVLTSNKKPVNIKHSQRMSVLQHTSVQSVRSVLQ